MKLIPLTQGKSAMVDDDDYHYLMQWKWHAAKDGNTYYALRACYENGKNIKIKMHRLLLGLDAADMRVGEHKDRNGLNNQRHNLRTATHRQNAVNRAKKPGTTSRYLGVRLINHFMASIKVNGRMIRLGTFPATEQGEIDAAKAYDGAALKYNGDFAVLNFKSNQHE